MYLPFLRGKLYELKAIKEYIEEGYGKEYGRHIMPIIEPVKKDMRPMMSCLEVMGKAEMPFAVVLNTRVGDFRRTVFNIPLFLSDERLKDVKWTPAFEVNNNTDVEAVKSTIRDFGFEGVMLVFFTNVDIDDEKTRELLNSARVKYIVVLNLIQRPPIIEGLKETGKDIITIEDCFPEKSPNNAYRDNLDEFYSDTFSYYKSLFGLFGFSDFTTLARNFREGGVLPQVVAIHMTYRKTEKVVNVYHFLSDSHNGSNNIREEFREANAKIPPFYDNQPWTLAARQISGMAYPGLGAIKKFSIKNHFELMSRILHDKED